MQRMCMLGIRPTAISINTIVSACEKVSEWKTALGLLAELPEMGLLPDIISYNAAIGACSENWKQAVALFQNLLSTRLCPDQVTLGSLITACANAEQLPTIETLLEHMHQLCLEENPGYLQQLPQGLRQGRGMAILSHLPRRNDLSSDPKRSAQLRLGDAGVPESFALAIGVPPLRSKCFQQPSARCFQL